MALTVSQQKARLTALDKKISKAEAAVTELEALKAEREWYAAAPTVADRPKKPRKPRPTAEAAPANA